jgi:hypothetical protein
MPCSIRKKILHVNRNVLQSNAKHDTCEPPIRLQEGSQVSYAHEVELLDDAGRVVLTFIYRPDAPLPCGGKLWIETELECRVKVWPAEAGAHC